MNCELQHLPWKVEPQVDGAPYPEKIPIPGVLDAALPESDLSKFPDRTPQKVAMPDIEDEPLEDDAWIKAAFERFDQPEFNEAGYHHPREERVRNGKAGHFWHYTHYDFVRQPWDERCSLMHRERGYICTPGDLDDVLSYPKVCLETIKHIPKIPPRELVSSDQLVQKIRRLKPLLETIGEAPKKGPSRPTVDKLRDDPMKYNWWRRWIEPDPRLDPGLNGPISDALDDDFKPAGRALFILWWTANKFEDFIKACPESIKRYTGITLDPPTGENIIKVFMRDNTKGNGTLEHRDEAEKQLDILVNYKNERTVNHKTPKVLIKLDCFTAPPLYYLNPKCYDRLNK